MLCLLFFMLFISPAQAADNFIVVESEGSGLTRDEALADARRGAVQQAVGLVSSGVTEVIDERVRENVVQLSRAFIETYDIEDERSDGNIQRVKIKAWVRRENLLSGLLQKSPDKSPFDGAGLFAGAMTREQQIKEAAEMLVELFGSFPYANYIHTGVGADSLSIGSGQVTLDVRFSFDRERYFDQAVPLFAWTLDYLAEGRLKDVPFALKLEGGDPIVITPPSGLSSLSQYMAFMEIKNENRYMDIPGAGNFANIYLLKKNYYFDCYRVPAEAFAVLMEYLLTEGGQNRLTGRMFDGTDLKIAFRNAGGHVVKEHAERLHIHNVMVFANLAGLQQAPYTKGKPGQLNEQRHALFILPCFGALGRDARYADDYLMFENEMASISANLSAEEARQVSQADAGLVMNRGDR